MKLIVDVTLALILVVLPFAASQPDEAHGFEFQRLVLGGDIVEEGQVVYPCYPLTSNVVPLAGQTYTANEIDGTGSFTILVNQILRPWSQIKADILANERSELSCEDITLLEQSNAFQSTEIYGTVDGYNFVGVISIFDPSYEPPPCVPTPPPVRPPFPRPPVHELPCRRGQTRERCYIPLRRDLEGEENVEDIENEVSFEFKEDEIVDAVQNGESSTEETKSNMRRREGVAERELQAKFTCMTVTDDDIAPFRRRLEKSQDEQRQDEFAFSKRGERSLQIPDFSNACDDFFEDAINSVNCGGQGPIVDEDCRQQAEQAYNIAKNAAQGEYDDAIDNAEVVLEAAKAGAEALRARKYSKVAFECAKKIFPKAIAICLATKVVIIEGQRYLIKRAAQEVFDVAIQAAQDNLDQVLGAACATAGAYGASCVYCQNESPPSICFEPNWFCGIPPNSCGGGFGCYCDETVDGRAFCFQDFRCAYLPTCDFLGNGCPVGWGCLRNTCCGEFAVCAPPCGFRRRDLFVEELDFPTLYTTGMH